MRRLALCLHLSALSGSTIAAEFTTATVEKARASVVEMLVNDRIAGGGVWVAEDQVLTCAHPIPKPAAKLEVIDHTGHRRPAKLLAVDLGHDLALLSVTNAAEHAVTTLAARDAGLAEPVFTLGPALRNPPVFIPGHVASGRLEFAEWGETKSYVEVLLVAGLTPQLTSGGPWFNQAGELHGVQNGFLNMDKGDPSGLALTAPRHAVRRMVETRIDAATPDLGAWFWEIWTAAPEHIANFPSGTNGLIVTRLTDDGPMAKAGIKRLDLITACDDQPVARRHDLLDRLLAKKSGEPVELTVLSPKDKEARKTRVTPEWIEPRWRSRK